MRSGTAVRLKRGGWLTTLYGHGAGAYRNWTAMSRIYFVATDDPLGRNWTVQAVVPWQPAMGPHADGPGEPATVRLADGRLLCVFRADAMTNYWRTESLDDGLTWSPPQRLAQPWSVKPRLLFVPALQALLLTGGRPGLFLWTSTDGGDTWQAHNLAAAHNQGVSQPADRFGAAVVNVTSAADPRADPPQTSSYTGLALLQQSAGAATVLVSYDRLANGWSGPPGPWGPCDTLFTMRVHLQSRSLLSNKKINE